MTTADPLATQPGPSPSEPPPDAPPVTPSPPYSRPVTAANPPQAGLVAGVILAVIGGAFLVGRVLDLALGPEAWPLWIVLPGLALFGASFAVRSPAGLGLAIPGAIIATVGAILWVQDTYNLYATWAYAWALTAPTAPGFAVLAHGLARGDRKAAGDGLRTMLVGLGLFLGFALFFEGVLGLSGERVAGLEDVLPFVVIGLGALLVVLSFGGRREVGRRV